MPWFPLPGAGSAGVTIENVVGGSHTVAATDNGKVLRFTDADLVAVTLPVGLDEGTLVHLLFVGAAGGAVAGDGSSSVVGAGSVPQDGEASCLVSAPDTWTVLGTTS